MKTLTQEQIETLKFDLYRIHGLAIAIGNHHAQNDGKSVGNSYSDVIDALSESVQLNAERAIDTIGDL